MSSVKSVDEDGKSMNNDEEIFDQSEENYGDTDDADSVVSYGSSDAADILEKTREMQQEEKILLISRISRVADTSGIKPKLINQSWTAEALHDELHRLQTETEIAKSLKLQRRILLTVCTGMEYVHNHTPIRGRLDGWGENLLMNIDDFDDVFLRLHEKHKPKRGSGGGKMQEPEYELAHMLAYNAFTFAITSSIAKLTAADANSFKTQFQERTAVAKKDTDAFAAATDNTHGYTAKKTTPSVTKNMKGKRTVVLGG